MPTPTTTDGPEYCDYCTELATHMHDTESLCRRHQREHGTRHFHTPTETRRARDKATRHNQPYLTPTTPS